MTEADEILLERLEHRTDRLLRTIRASRGAVIKPVLAMMVEHVLWTSIALCPEELRNALWDHVVRAVQHEHQICIVCGERPASVDGICQPCEDEGRREDAQVEFDELSAEGAKH